MGQGVDQCTETAVAWLSKAAAQGDSHAKQALAKIGDIKSRTVAAAVASSSPTAAGTSVGGGESKSTVEADIIPSRVCANCDKPAAGPDDRTFKRCGRCKLVWYCCKTCQKKHWRKEHKHVCK
jgi:hypothetical protein